MMTSASPSARRWIMVGAGGMAGNWVRTFFTPFRDRAEIVALVDVNDAALERSGDFLGLPKERRFTRKLVRLP